MSTYLSIGEAATFIGVCVSTLRRWEYEGRYFADYRTPGGHRRYDLSRLEREILVCEPSEQNRKTFAYARVSSHDQKLDLKRQQIRLEEHCASQGWVCEVISDLGSGLNYNKKGLKQLIKLICTRQVSRLVLTHKDRLLRFGSQLLFRLCDHFNTQVIILEQQLSKSFEQELTADVIELMTVFTARIHGKRSHKNRLKIQPKSLQAA